MWGRYPMRYETTTKLSWVTARWFRLQTGLVLLVSFVLINFFALYDLITGTGIKDLQKKNWGRIRTKLFALNLRNIKAYYFQQPVQEDLNEVTCLIIPMTKIERSRECNKTLLTRLRYDLRIYNYDDRKRLIPGNEIFWYRRRLCLFWIIKLHLSRVLFCCFQRRK